MPVYTFVNRKTEEEQERFMSIADRETFLNDNPDWVQKPAGIRMVDGTKDIYAMRDGGFKEVLEKVKKGSGRENTIRL